MDIKKISENQIRCIIYAEDLHSRDLQLSDLAFSTERAKAFFSEIMILIAKKYNFNLQKLPTMIEAIPDGDRSITLIITKVNNQEELDKKFPDLKKQEKPKYAPSKEKQANTSPKEDFKPKLYSFKTLKEVMIAAKYIVKLYSFNNSLYKDIEHDLYILAIIPKSKQNIKFKKACNMLCEFGTYEESCALSLAYLEEHCSIIIPKHALQTLADLDA